MRLAAHSHPRRAATSLIRRPLGKLVRGRLGPLVLLASAAATAGCGGSPPASVRVRPSAHSTRMALVRDASAARVIGRSVRGRPIAAHEIGSPAAPTRVLVVGAIHGDEPAGIAVARALDRSAPRGGLDLWVIDDLNPDGVHARTRQNAHGVDLNRNFPFRWHASGQPFDQQYPGPRPLSEPESTAARRLISRLAPAVTIWFHQPLGLVDDSSGSRAVEARFARAARLPLRALTRYPGSAMGWQNHVLPATTAFVVELHRGSLTASEVRRLAAAVLSMGRRG